MLKADGEKESRKGHKSDQVWKVLCHYQQGGGERVYMCETEEGKENVYVCMYVCMYECVRECMKGK